MEDYKEKYEQALERAKVINPGTADYEVAVKIFPELKESEDERIKKFISHELACLRAADEKGSDRYKELTDAIAWLEKQGEKKSTDKVEPKFHKGDWIISNNVDKDYHICKITDIKDNNYTIESIYGYKGYNQSNMFDNAYRLWTIQDVKNGDVIASNQIIILFKKFQEDSNCNFVIAHAGIDVSGKLQITNEHWLMSNQSKPATKEQRDILFQKMKEAGYEWDSEKKELKKIEQKPIISDDAIREGVAHFGITQYQITNWLKKYVNVVNQKPAWSEEDEERLNSIIESYKELLKDYKACHDVNYIPYNSDTLIRNVVNDVNFLKSLKQRIKV